MAGRSLEGATKRFRTPTELVGVGHMRMADGTCMELPASGNTFASSGGLVPPTEFVAATIVESTGSRLVRRHFAAEDGAVGGGSAFTLIDSTLGSLCYSRRATDGSFRCMPNAATAVNRFADASCTQDMVPNGPFECGERLRFAIEEVEETCGVALDGTELTYPLRDRLYALVDPIVPTALYALSYDDTGAPVCEPQTVTPEEGAYSAFGPEVVPDSLAELEEREVACGLLGAAGERLRVRDLVSEGHSAARGHWLFDSAIEEYCVFDVAADGVLRCLPISMELISSRYFADSACRRPVVAFRRCRMWTQSNYAQGGEAAPGECVDGADSEEFRISVHSLGERYTPTALYAFEPVPEGQAARCLPIEESLVQSLADLTRDYEFREVGAEVPSSRFVAGRVETY